MSDNSEGSYPQRSRVPRQEVETAKPAEGHHKECVKAQCGRNGMPFMDDRFDEPGKPPATHVETEYNRDA